MKRTRLLRFVLSGVALALCLGDGLPLAADQSATTVMVPMSDGTRLATDVYLPSGEGPWPVLLSRTPYNKNRADGKKKATALGYAVVIQDMRGRFASEGKDLAFQDCGWGENKDGLDTVKWILEQPWCNGKLGTRGGSALGITQNLLAGAKPPNVLCQHIGVAASNLYAQAVYQGGAFRQSQVVGWLVGNDFDADNVELMQQHPLYDDFWRDLDSETRFEEINLPGFFQGGWYDTFSQGTINAFVGRQYQGGPGARGRQKLLMGPWTHGGSHKRRQGELSYPKNVVKLPDVGDVRLWFDYWLKGEETGIMELPAVTYYLMGDVDDPDAPGNEWRTSDVWPVPSTPVEYYFHRDASLSKSKPGAGEEPQTYTYDPENPVPTKGGLNLVLPAGPQDQRTVEARPDVLLFTTAPLEEPVEVTGRIKVLLWASSSAVDTDFTAKLTDVYPDGRSMLVLDGIIRARSRESREKVVLMEPGKSYRFELDLWSTAIVFNKGHRLRVALSSSNVPRFAANPNTGEEPWEETPPVKAQNTIYHDAEHPSHILLPVIEG